MDDSANKSNRSTATALLSEKRAKQFVVEQLGIEALGEKFRNDKVSLLNEIITAWQNRIPFQNISLMASAADPSERRIPTMEENVTSVLSLQGGCCWTHNTVMHTILNALGYEVMLCLCGVFSPDNNTHVVVIVKNMTAPNSFHVVDVGFGCISPKAICLDFEEESEVVDNIYTPCKYIKYEGWFVRCHKPKSREIAEPKASVVTIDGWDLVYYFKLQEYTYEQVKAYLGAGVYHQPDDFFNQVIYSAVVSDGKFVFLHNRKLKVEKTPGGEVEVVMLEQDEQLLDAIFKNFPTIPEEEAMCAVENWRNLKSGLDKKPNGEEEVPK